MITRRKGTRVGALLAALLLIVGCSTIQPFHPPNHREEGPAKGLFTGSQGEWAIYGPKAPQEVQEENRNTWQETEREDEQKKAPKTVPSEVR